MHLLKDKRAFVDGEVLASPGFVILVVMAVGATLLGWILGPQMGFEEKLPIWQLLLIIVVETIVCYVIVARSS